MHEIKEGQCDHAIAYIDPNGLTPADGDYVIYSYNKATGALHVEKIINKTTTDTDSFVGTGLVRPGASVGQIQIYGGIFIEHGAHKGRITVAERQGYDRILLFPFLCINVAFHHNGDSGIFGHSRSVCRICIDCHFAAVCADGIVVRLNGAAADGSVSVNRKDAFCLTFGMYIHVPGNRQFGTAAVAVDEDGTTVAVAAIEHRLDSAAVVDDEFRIPGTIVPCAAGLAALDGNGPRRQEGVLHCCV